MCKHSRLIFVISLYLAIIFNFNSIFGCNEAVCASMVSKCMLTNSCNCTISNYDCLKECFDCLNYLFDECCSCLDLCPKSNEDIITLNKSSQVGDFDDPVPMLFEFITSKPDIHQRWTVFSYKIEGYTKISVNPDEMKRDNCTVAFMVECTSLQKCKRSCQSIGSSGYRWFHDGCCECIGSNCINYGIKESKCLRCPYGPLTIPQVLEEEKAYDDFGQDYEEYECDHAVSICPLRQ